MKITTSTELINYIQNNFNEITAHDYINLISATLNVYHLNKPKNVLQAIKMINEWSSMPVELRPLLID